MRMMRDFRGVTAKYLSLIQYMRIRTKNEYGDSLAGTACTCKVVKLTCIVLAECLPSRGA